MITISENVLVGAAALVAFAGFMLGYAIAWRQRGGSQPDETVLAPELLFVGGAAEVVFVCDCQVPPGKHPGFAAVSCGCPIHGDAADIRRGWA